MIRFQVGGHYAPLKRYDDQMVSLLVLAQLILVYPALCCFCSIRLLWDSTLLSYDFEGGDFATDS